MPNKMKIILLKIRGERQTVNYYNLGMNQKAHSQASSHSHLTTKKELSEDLRHTGVIGKIVRILVFDTQPTTNCPISLEYISYEPIIPFVREASLSSDFSSPKLSASYNKYIFVNDYTPMCLFAQVHKVI